MEGFKWFPLIYAAFSGIIGIKVIYKFIFFGLTFQNNLLVWLKDLIVVRNIEEFGKGAAEYDRECYLTQDLRQF
jgi:hypothetical protein